MDGFPESHGTNANGATVINSWSDNKRHSQNDHANSKIKDEFKNHSTFKL